MTRFEVLVEGASDVPAIREVLARRFGLVEGQDFRIHPHKGRGRLPANPLARPDPKQETLLHQLPAKLRGFSYWGDAVCVLVVVDVDDTPCADLLNELRDMLNQLTQKPQRVLFRLAIEETESWFIADTGAVKAAFPKADIRQLRQLAPDAIVGAWEKLADSIGHPRNKVTGRQKYAWAEQIVPHLELNSPFSPSLNKLIDGIEAELR